MKIMPKCCLFIYSPTLEKDKDTYESERIRKQADNLIGKRDDGWPRDRQRSSREHVDDEWELQVKGKAAFSHSVYLWDEDEEWDCDCDAIESLVLMCCRCFCFETWASQATTTVQKHLVVDFLN